MLRGVFEEEEKEEERKAYPLLLSPLASKADPLENFSAHANICRGCLKSDHGCWRDDRTDVIYFLSPGNSGLLAMLVDSY